MDSIASNGRKVVVGTKQTLRALEAKKAELVYLAQDASDFLKEKIISACREANVEVCAAPSMAKLGLACAIDIGAACAAILKN